jgi:manganese/zinc/iron transport system permease protein
MHISLQILLVGSCLAVLTALLGSFLVLRKNVMIADAISHAVLPGIVVAFLLTGSLRSFGGVVGAALLGLLATVMIETLHKKVRIQADAAMGVSFTFLFAVGLVLIAFFAQNSDLDIDCVLYGELDYVALHLWRIDLGDGRVLNLGAKAAWQIGGVTVLVALIFKLGYRYFVLTTFDSPFAKSAGISVEFWHYLLMTMVCLSVVVVFESVGVILVLALLTAPAATAYLFSKSLPKMLLLAVLFGISAVWIGYGIAFWLDAATAACIASVAGAQFFIALRLKAQ